MMNQQVFGVTAGFTAGMTFDDFVAHLKEVAISCFILAKHSRTHSWTHAHTLNIPHTHTQPPHTHRHTHTDTHRHNDKPHPSCTHRIELVSNTCCTIFLLILTKAHIDNYAVRAFSGTLGRTFSGQVPGTKWLTLEEGECP